MSWMIIKFFVIVVLSIILWTRQPGKVDNRQPQTKLGKVIVAIDRACDVPFRWFGKVLMFPFLFIKKIFK